MDFLEVQNLVPKSLVEERNVLYCGKERSIIFLMGLLRRANVPQDKETSGEDLFAIGRK